MLSPCMSLEVGSAIKYGVKRPLERDGLMVVAVLWIVMLVNEAMGQTTASGVMQEFMGEELPAGAGEFLGSDMVAPLALPIPNAVATLLGLVASILTITVMIVAYRTFVEETGESIPEESYQRNIVSTTIHGFIASIVFGILFVIGLVLLVIPGIFIAVSLAFFLAIIALEDVGFVEGLQQSWELTKGKRFDVFLLGVGIVVVGLVIGIVGGIVSGALGFGSAALGAIVGIAFSAYSSAFTVGTLTHAYLQLDEDTEATPSAE